MVCIITGASAGIGMALAKQLSCRGAKLVLAARRLERLEALNLECGGPHRGQHLVLAADVSQPQDCRRIIDAAVGRFGRIDTLVANAGYGMLCPVAQTPLEDIEKILRTNILGTTECIRHVVAQLRCQEVRDGRRGQIVIVSSAAARRGLPFYGWYAATKAAQLSLAEALRIELASDEIAVTTVHPMGTQTDFFDAAERNSQFKVPPALPGERRQDVESVVTAMVKAIQSPRREVWPARWSRALLNLAVLFPALGDRVMRKAHRQIMRHNR